MNLKVSGIQGIVVFLFVVATFGAMHLLAASAPDTKAARIWTGLGF